MLEPHLILSLVLKISLIDEPKIILFRETMAYDLILAIGTGVVSGIIAALIFFLILRIFKPIILISDKIVKQMVIKEGKEVFYYVFKFINMTKSDIENVSIDLFLMEDYFNGNAKNYKTKRLEVAVPEFKFLTGTKYKNKDIHNNCVQMVIKEPLEEKWNGEKEWLHVQIDSTHSKSGRRKVYVKTFKDPNNSIVTGKFDSGENFKIIN